MAQDSEVAIAKQGVDVTDQQPSSPTGSNSSREETRVTREQLKKTSIAGLSQTSAALEVNAQNEGELISADATVNTANGIRGRPAKKRSFEDLTKDDVDVDNTIAEPPLPKSGHHKRMRSRDINSADHSALVKAEAERAETLHEESDLDAQTAPGGPAVLVDAPSQEEMDAATTQAQTEQLANTTAKPIADREPVSKIPPTSGFANASTASPFGSASPSMLKSTDTPQPTSSSAFASSGLSAFAASDKSPFGAAGGKSPLGGGLGGSFSGGFGATKGGLGSTGGFGSANTSVFGGGSSTFGQPRSFAGASSAFGAPKPFAPSSSAFGGDGSAFAKGKPFTSTKKEDEDEAEGQDEGNEEDSSTAKDDDFEQDPRFHEQQIETGEDGEDTSFSARARIYIFDTAWKERGTGTFKVNIRNTESSEVDPESQQTTSRRKARLLMRADATHRVILNSPIFKGMQFGAYGNSAPTGKTMTLQCQEEGKVVLLQIKIGKEEVLRKLYDLLKELEAEA